MSCGCSRHCHGEAVVLQYNDSMGPAAGEEINGGRGEREGGSQNCFTQEQDEKKSANMCDGLCTCMYSI